MAAKLLGSEGTEEAEQSSGWAWAKEHLSGREAERRLHYLQHA